MRKLRSPFRQIRDGKWHIDFQEWLWSALRVLVQWGLFPFVLYTGFSNATELTGISPIATNLILAFLAVRLLLVSFNPPKYQYPIEKAKEESE